MLKKKINVSQTKSELAYQAIKDAIISNELLPGEEVSMGSLADYLGISPTPVREAVARLHSDGLIKYEAHKRLTISEITENDIAEIYAVRRLIEPYVAEKAASVLSESSEKMDSIKMLREKAERLAEQKGDIDYDDYLEIDKKLDQFLLDQIGQGVLFEVYQFVSERSMRARTFSEAASDQKPTSMMRKITLEHLEILDALLARNPKLVREKVHEHLVKGEERTKEAVRGRLKN